MPAPLKMRPFRSARRPQRYSGIRHGRHFTVEPLEWRQLLSAELLQNPSFTSGSASWNITGDFWAGTTKNNPHTSPGYAVGAASSSTGNAKNNASGSMYQQVTIPATATAVSASWWLSIATQETSTTTAFDIMQVNLLDTAGNLLTHLAAYSNLDKSAYHLSTVYDLTAYAGQTVRLQFQATSDGSSPTTFRIDDASVAYKLPGDLTVPALNSRPGAPYTLYLDFAGFSFSGTWGPTGQSPGTTPAYDDDNDATGFTPTELANIHDIWSRVAEAYAPFHINVTTVDPAVAAGMAGSDSLRQSYYDSQPRMMHTVIGGTGAWFGSAGGVSFVGVTPGTTTGGQHTNWIFTAYNNESPADFLQYVGEAAAHENGHGLGLNHQADYSGSTLVNEYSSGTLAVAPIMGVAYNATRGLFAVGTAHAGGMVTQNDVQTIVNDASMGGYVVDGVGQTLGTATVLPSSFGTIDSSQALGLIVPKSVSSPNPVGSANYTADFWSFTGPAGNASITVNSGRSTITPGVADAGATLNTELLLLDSSGNVIASASTSSLSETLTVSLSAGTYYIEILATGDASDSTYTLRNFFDMGDYFLSGTIPSTPANTIAGRFVFYNGSSFDTGGHDNAIAPDKSALLPGQTATFTNYTSYSRGINGIMVDIAGTVGTLSASDFVFRIGNDSTPSGSAWTTVASTASIVMRPGAGVGSSTRIEITWANNAISNEWLQVTVKKDANTGLAADDVFYFGNAIGESGDSTTDAQVNAFDEIGARELAADLTALSASQAMADPYDYNRDGHVNAADESLAGSHYTTFINALNLITPPAPPSSSPPLAAPLAPGSAATTDPVSPAPTIVVLPDGDPDGPVVPVKKKVVRRLSVRRMGKAAPQLFGKW